jgi:nitrous oxidase accessory protein NosD
MVGSGMSLKKIWVFVWLLFPGWLQGAEYYVSPTGSDDAKGSREYPWRTVQQAASRLQPGDTAHVLPGRYVEKVVIPVSGSEGGGFVTLAAEEGAILSGEGVKGQNMVLIEDQNFVRVKGFEIRDLMSKNEGSGIRVEGGGSHIELLGNEIHEMRGKNAMGITIYGSRVERPISNLVIDGNTIHDCEPAKSEALTLNGNVTDFAVTNNVVRDVNNIGIDFIGGESWLIKDATKVVRNGVCRGNTVERARSVYGGGYAAGIYVDGARDIAIEGNRVTGCDLGIEIGAENKAQEVTGITVRGNAVFRNEKAGLVIGGYEKKVGRVRGCVIEGNIFYGNTRVKKGEAELWIQWASGNTFRDNIFYGTGSHPLLYSEEGNTDNVLEGNTWFCEGAPGNAVFVWRGKEYEGFGAYVAGSGVGKGSKFERPAEIPIPEGE